MLVVSCHHARSCPLCAYRRHPAAGGEDCWVEFTTARGRYLFQTVVAGGTSQRWVFRHAVDMQLGNPGGISLTVDGRNPLPPGTAQPITLRFGLGSKITT